MGRTPVQYTPIHPSETETLDERHDRLSAAQAQGTDVPSGAIWGLPDPPAGDVWVDLIGASVITGQTVSGIRNRLNRSEKFRKPFPTPVKYLGILLWPKTIIDAWVSDD